MVHKDSIHIRQAAKEDLSRVLELYKAALDELDQKWSHDRLVKKIADSFILAPCFLVESNGIICGMAGFTVVSASHNGEESLADYMFYVKPEQRNLRTLKALLYEVKAYAKQQNLPIRVEYLCNNDEALKRRLLSLNGFEVRGIIGVCYE